MLELSERGLESTECLSEALEKSLDNWHFAIALVVDVSRDGCSEAVVLVEAVDRVVSRSWDSS